MTNLPHDLLMELGEQLQMAAEDSEDYTTYERHVKEVVKAVEAYYIGYAFESPQDEMVKQMCELHHEWYTAMFYELGGWFYSHEEVGPYCPRCGREAVS